MDAVDPLILAAMLGAAVARARPPVASVARLAVVTFVALGLKQRTVPISRRHTTTLKADLKPGSYRVGVVGGGITPARLHVGAERPSAQNVLLQP
jgi:hypothetical protein